MKYTTLLKKKNSDLGKDDARNNHSFLMNKNLKEQSCLRNAKVSKADGNIFEKKNGETVELIVNTPVSQINPSNFDCPSGN